ncbi:hypothetical protein BURC_02242 [Burkholderiaceae bacterium]|nr:hypothetical protein BURC_02242 [Burkholderiaceae bacterium]
MLRRAPPAPLAPFIECLWFAEREALPHTRERGLPTGCADIVIPLLPRQHILRYDSESAAVPRRLRGGVLQGPHDRVSVRGTEGPSAVIGVHFRPGGAAAWFGGALPELRNRTLPLDELWGCAASTLRDELQNAGTPQAALQRLESHLLRRLHRAPSADTMVLQAIGALQRDPTRALIDPVQRASGCTPAQFIGRFERAVGLTPKRYARVLRFHSMLPVLVRAGPRDWAQIAVAAGYFDQSHLIHEFRRLSGLTPGAYRPVQPDQPTHVAIAS